MFWWCWIYHSVIFVPLPDITANCLHAMANFDDILLANVSLYTMQHLQRLEVKFTWFVIYIYNIIVSEDGYNI